MRTFNAISIGFLWSVAFLSCLGYFIILALNVILPATASASVTLDQAAGYTRLFWFSIATMSVLAGFMCFAIGHFWFRRGRSPGFGFWLSTLLLFFLVAAIPASGFAPYFAVGDRSALQWVSLVVGGVFLVVSFSRLPKEFPRTPPPLG
jgi:hypothetical protein